MKHIVCFGEALVDFLEKPPIAGESPCFEQHAGGAPANVAAAVARLGGKSAFIGMLARDNFGDFLLEHLKSAGVNVECVTRTERARTALAFVSLGPGGERSFSFYRPPAADLLFRPEHFPEKCFDCSAFHACSNTLTEAPIAEATLVGMRRSRERGALVSFDVNLRPDLWPSGQEPAPRIWQALGESDLAKFSENEFDFLAASAGGEADALERLFAGGVRLVVVTTGAGRVRYFTGGLSGAVPAIPVKAVDTTGAGDAFMGGLLYRLAQSGRGTDGLDGDAQRIEEDLRFAAACGAVAVSRRGSFASMPSAELVHELLRAGG